MPSLRPGRSWAAGFRPQKIRRYLKICGVAFLILELVVLTVTMGIVGSTSEPSGLDIPIFDKTRSLKRQPNKLPDGSFLGYPVYFQNVTTISHTKPYTLQHCVGENYQAQESWKHRSCRFKFLCFNLATRGYEAYQRPGDADLASLIHRRPLFDLSETYLQADSIGVSLGGVNVDWGEAGTDYLRWFPRVVRYPPAEFYSLPDEVVMIPYLSTGGWKPSRVIWEDILAMFTLMQMFDFDDRIFDILAIRQELELDNDEAFETCENEACQRMQADLLPMLNKQSTSVSLHDAKLLLADSQSKRQSDLVCAKNAMAGLGSLTDHGPHKLHGTRESDYETTHNHGRGQLLWRFREFTLANLGILDPTGIENREAQIVLATCSSKHASDKSTIDFSQLESLLRSQLDSRSIHTVIQSIVVDDLSLTEQAILATETTILITGCDAATKIATWLPQGATLVVYFDEFGRESLPESEARGPARLNWDVLNNLSYLNVHWFPSGGTESRREGSGEEVNLLVEVIVSDLIRRSKKDLKSS